MFPSQLGDLELLEAGDLPARTLMAPLPLIREIRLVLGKSSINLLVGEDSAVYVSTDLFEAYAAWDDRRTDVDPQCN